MNDVLGDIRDDPKFGEKLYEAVNHLSVSKGFYPDIRINAATAIETHHADGFRAIMVGDNGAITIDNVYVAWDNPDPELALPKIEDSHYGANRRR